jgi:hypothetical protein
MFVCVCVCVYIYIYIYIYIYTEREKESTYIHTKQARYTLQTNTRDGIKSTHTHTHIHTTIPVYSIPQVQSPTSQAGKIYITNKQLQKQTRGNHKHANTQTHNSTCAFDPSGPFTNFPSRQDIRYKQTHEAESKAQTHKHTTAPVHSILQVQSQTSQQLPTGAGSAQYPRHPHAKSRH